MPSDASAPPTSTSTAVWPPHHNLDAVDGKPRRFHLPLHVQCSATRWEVDLSSRRHSFDLQGRQRTDRDEGVAFLDRRHPILIGQGACAELRVAADTSQEVAGRHLVGATDKGDLQPQVQVAIPVGQTIGAHVEVQGVVGIEVERVHRIPHLDGVDQTQDEVGGPFELGKRSVGHHHEAALVDALLGPVRHRHLEWVAGRGFVRPSGAQWVDYRSGVAEERDVTEHLGAVLGADADEVLARAVDCARADGGSAVEVADVGEHLSPLRREDVRDVDAFGLTFEARGLGTQEVDVGVGAHPASFAPVE